MSFHLIDTIDVNRGDAPGRVSFSGSSRVRMQDGLIACHAEVLDRGSAFAQIDFPPERIVKSLKRWAEEDKRSAG